MWPKVIAKEFGIQKCACIIFKRRKIIIFDSMKLSEGREISALEQGEGFKYLSVLEAGDLFY